MNKNSVLAVIAAFLVLGMFSCSSRDYANNKISLEGAIGSFENKSSGEGYLLFHLNHVIDDFFDEEAENLAIPEDKKVIQIHLTGDNSLGKMEVNSLDFILLDTKSNETQSTTILVDSDFDALEKYSQEGYLSFLVPKDAAVENYALGMKFLFAEKGGESDFSRFIPLKAGENLPAENKVTQVNKSIELSYFGDAKGTFTVNTLTENIPAGEYSRPGQRLISLDVKFENNSDRNFWVSDPYLMSNIHFGAVAESSVEGESNLFDSGSVKPGESISGKIFFETFIGDGGYKLRFSDTEVLSL